MDAMPWRPPADALQLSLGDPFMSEAAASPEADEHRCDAFRVAPDPSTFVVGYPDRGTETLAVSNMCTDLAVNGKELAAPAVLVLFEDALAAQRERFTPNSAKNLTFDCIAAVDPGGHAEVPTTRGPRPAAETRFVRFVSCMGNERVAVDIDAVTKLNEQWPASIRDMATQLPLDVDRCPAVDVDVPATYGVTTWGDVLEFRFRGCGNYIVRGDAESNADAFGPHTLQFLPPKELADALGLLYDLT
ncbi:MAG: hypothetical protein H0T17_01330 [Propionibacteriales bacterium]|nr:hypothetical protein [Propionibacteriales bacterium]